MHRRGLSGRGDRGARLFGDLARAAQLERRRDPEPRRRAGRNRPRPARRSRRRAEPLHRGGGLRHPDRQPLCAQRQSVAGAEVRLQARLDGPAARPRAAPARQRLAGDADRRLQRHPDRAGRLQAGALGEGRALLAGSARRSSRSWSTRAGPTRSASSIRTSASTPSGIIGGTRSSATPASASTIRCSARRSRRSSRRPASTASRAAGRRPAITRRCGSRSRSRRSIRRQARGTGRSARSTTWPSISASSASASAKVRSASSRASEST